VGDVLELQLRSTWLRPCAECSKDDEGADVLIRSSADDRPANSIRCSTSTTTATGDRSKGDATSRRVRSAGTSRGT
jgi:hypothetical protein